MNDTPRVTVPVDYETLSELHTLKGWLHGLANHMDLCDVVADGGVTAGMAYQQEATEFAGRLRRILDGPLSAAPAPEGGAVAMIRALLDHIDRETCHHDNLKRGGVQWTICEDCDRKWADDQGGFKPHVDAPPVAAARLYLAALATRSDGKPEGGAVKGPGDYTMALTEPQAFERFPALASHIERMAVGRSVGSLIEWDAFLRELNAALATREEAPAEAGEYQVGEFIGRQPVLCRHGSTDPNNLCDYCEDDKVWPGRAQPPAREDAQPVAWKATIAPETDPDWPEAREMDSKVFCVTRPDGQRHSVIAVDANDAVMTIRELHPYTHPAPDALRVAVEALEALAGEEGDCGEKVYVPCTWKPFREVARQALATIAALQAEQKGGA